MAAAATVAPSGPAAPAATAAERHAPQRNDVVVEAEVRSAHERGERVLRLGPRGSLTPGAREAAERLGLEVRRVADPVAQPRYTCPSAEVRRVALGSDHGGYEMKERLHAHLASRFLVVDLGCHSPDPVDYPDYARAVAEAVARGQAERGVVVDGVGIGSAMAANKVVGVRAACCRDTFEARNAREHNDTNVLCLGGRTLGEAVAFQVADTWLATDFGGGRHAGRVDKVLAIERAYAGV
ncbi:MAG: ribose 5-phosphate isomerase B [Planctomycetes bacterium]|nr:ribose 5-phosphate isomerase B [Planctomycetota bacterium]